MIIDTHTHWGTVWEDAYGTDPGEWLNCIDKYAVVKVILLGHRGLTRNSDITKLCLGPIYSDLMLTQEKR